MRPGNRETLYLIVAGKVETAGFFRYIEQC